MNFSEDEVEDVIRQLLDIDGKVSRSALKDFLEALMALPSSLWSLVRKDRRVVEILFLGLQDDDMSVVCNSVIALQKTDDTRAVEPFIAALQKMDIREGMIIGMISQVLARLDDPRAVKPLIEKLKEQKTSACGSIARSLGLFHDAAAVEVLIEFTRLGISPKFGVVVNALFEILELFFECLVGRSDCFMEGDRALELILASNKPLLQSYPNLLCSQCWLRAQRHFGWLTFYRRIMYVTCRNCGSSRHLIPNVSKVTGIIGGSFKDLVISENHATVPLWSEEKEMPHIADIDYLDIRKGGVSNYSETINRVVKAFQEHPLSDGALLKKVDVKVQHGVDLNSDVLKILNEYFKGVILE